jgi:hypothetical protein
MKTLTEIIDEFIDNYEIGLIEYSQIRDDFIAQLEEYYKPKSICLTCKEVCKATHYRESCPLYKQATPLEPIDRGELRVVIENNAFSGIETMLDAILAKFGVSNKLEPLDEKAVEQEIERCLLAKIKEVELHWHSYYGVPSNLIYLLRDAICAKFGSPTKKEE